MILLKQVADVSLMRNGQNVVYRFSMEKNIACVHALLDFW